MDELFARQSELFYYLLALAFAVIAGWETFRPRRSARTSTARRWGVHFFFYGTGNLLAFWVYPASAVTAALLAQDWDWPLLRRFDAPAAVDWVLAFAALDFVKYGQHRLSHTWGPLWRLHRLHHADPDYDLTTAFRFHPLEQIYLNLTYVAPIAALGLDPVAVLAYEIVAIFQAFFSHGNVALPEAADAGLRRFVVTPDMHRVHHSERADEQQSNFGSLFPWWDRWLGTYRAQPADGHAGMRVGLEGCDARESLSLWRMLVLPFRGEKERRG